MRNAFIMYNSHAVKLHGYFEIDGQS
jgi:hypothetical protein